MDELKERTGSNKNLKVSVAKSNDLSVSGYQVPVICVEPRPLDLRRSLLRLRWSAEKAEKLAGGGLRERSRLAGGGFFSLLYIYIVFISGFRNFWNYLLFVILYICFLLNFAFCEFFFKTQKKHDFCWGCKKVLL